MAVSGSVLGGSPGSDKVVHSSSAALIHIPPLSRKLTKMVALCCLAARRNNMILVKQV